MPNISDSDIRNLHITGNLKTISEAIEIQQRAVQLTPDGHADLPAPLLSELRTSFKIRYGRTWTSDLLDISEAILNHQRAVLVADGDVNLPCRLNSFGVLLQCRFIRSGDLDDLCEAIQIQQRVVQLTPDTHGNLPALLNILGMLFRYRFECTGYLADISEAIQAQQRAVHLTPVGDVNLLARLNNLGILFVVFFRLTKDPLDISKAIQIQQRAIQLIPVEHADLPSHLNNLGLSFQSRFELNGNLADISEAIQMQQRAVHLTPLTPDGNVNLLGRLNNLGISFICRFKRTEDPLDISEAIEIQRRAIQLTPLEHADSPSQLNNLGLSLQSRFELNGNIAEIVEAIKIQQLAVHLTPDGDVNLVGRLNNLGTSLQSRFKQTGDFADLSEAIQIQQRAVQLTPDTDANLPGLLSNLGNTFIRLFERTGDFAAVFEAIEIQQRAVLLTPDGHASLPAWLSNLGISLRSRFERAGDLADISKAIQIQQRAVQLTPVGHAGLPSRLNSLGISFIRRSERTRDLADISEAIQVLQRAVQLTPDEHGHLPAWLNNLGNSFIYRFELIKDISDISEAIEIQHRAVQLTPDTHAELPMLLNNLGISFRIRFQVEPTKNLEDISEAINIQQRAVQLSPEGHANLPGLLNNLGNYFRNRYEHSEDLSDISEAIQIQERGIRLTPDGHAYLAAWRYNLAESFLCRYEHSEDLDDPSLISALSNFRLSAISSTGPPHDRLSSGIQWTKLSTLSKISSSDSLVEANECLIHLLSLISSLDNTVQHRYESLTDISQLTTTASAAALSVDCSEKALEWLEEGRSIVWNHINQLRTPVEELRAHDSDLEYRFSTLSLQLENAGFRTDPRTAGGPGELSMAAKMSLHNEAHHHIELAQEWDALLTSIRNIPQFKKFLRPRKYEDLLHGLPEGGHVIVINVDPKRCDALALVAGCSKPIHIPLGRFSYIQAKSLANRLRSYLSKYGLLTHYSDESPPSDPLATAPYKSTTVLGELLKTLWTDLVEPILQALAIRVPVDGSNDLPRIWWCPTGPLAFLPIHAAGIYEQDKPDCLADFVVSSYIPTISVLNGLHSRAPSNTVNDGVLLVSQPDTPGLPNIPCITAEVEKTREQLENHEIRSLLYTGGEATVDVVLESMETFSCVHLACHASQDIKNPLKSAIHLYDRPLTLSEIMKKKLPDAGLAFMSVCQTNSGDENLSEAVHLAAGYKSVVATMCQWSISDKYAPEVAEIFYKNLLSNDISAGSVKLDVTKSALALHTSVQHLRKKLGNSPEALRAWIPYIHVGS